MNAWFLCNVLLISRHRSLQFPLGGFGFVPCVGRRADMAEQTVVIEEVSRISYAGREVIVSLPDNMLELNLCDSKLASLIGRSKRCSGLASKWCYPTCVGLLGSCCMCSFLSHETQSKKKHYRKVLSRPYRCSDGVESREG